MPYHRTAAAALLAMAGTALLPMPSGAAGAKPVFDLSAPGHKEWTFLAKKNAGNNPTVPGCNGGNESPALRWSNAPANTKSFAIVLIDLSGNPPLGFVHWVAYGIPAGKTSLKEGEASKPSNEFIGGKSGIGRDTYFGPCPPAGEKAHPFTFVLMATDLEPKALSPGLTRDDLATALKGHIVGRTTLVLRYGG
jgi:Raf kinase inhibitor-like YbhB/YbcL family protein